jgi:hypothetical protein
MWWYRKDWVIIIGWGMVLPRGKGRQAKEIGVAQRI